MLIVRELKELTQRLDLPALEKQLGPFVLVQRPRSAPPANRANTLETKSLAGKVPRSKTVFDFEDLWVATLPPMSSRDSFVLGRSPDCDVVIDEETVSKTHARIDWQDGAATLSDLGSSNGLLLNTVKVKGTVKLGDNDLIALGTVEMFFMLVATLRRRMGVRAWEK